MNEVNGILINLHDFTRPTGDGPIILSASSKAFTMTEPALFNDSGKKVAIPPRNEAVSATVRESARVYSFKVEVNAMKAIKRVSPELAKLVELKVVQFPVAIAIPTQESEESGKLVIINSLLSVLHKPNKVIKVIRNHLSREPTYGYNTRNPSRTFMMIDEKSFTVDFKEHVNWCCFQVYHQLLRKEFLPNTPFDSGAIVRAIHECKQTYWDPNTRQMFSKKFAARLNTWPADLAYPEDSPLVFWQNLDKPIHEEAATMLPDPYVPPPRKPSERNHQADERLRQIKQTAISLERKMKNVALQVQQLARFTQNQQGMGGATRTFITEPQDPSTMAMSSSLVDEALQMLNMQPVATWSHTAHSHAGYEAARWDEGVSHDHSFQALPKIINVHQACEVLCAQALVMVSTAKQAIQRARGESANRGPCWGCEGLEAYQADSFTHLWSDCPHKAVIEVRQNAHKNMKQFLASRSLRTQHADDQKPAAKPQVSSQAFHLVLNQRLAELKNSWEDEGHPSFERVALMTSILDPNTGKNARKACYQVLARSGTKQRSTSDVQAGTAKLPPPQHSTNDGGQPMLFVGIPVLPVSHTSVMQAGIFAPPVLFPLSQIMPHASIGIGLKGMGSLVAMVDSGFGCSIGRLSYHKSIADNVPELVAKFEWIPENNQIGIGGVDAQGSPIKITAIVIYHTPYRCDGQPVQLTFGLSSHISTNTILGIPFLCQAHAAIMMNTDNGKESLVCSRFGQIFPLLYQPPHLADEAPTSGLSVAGGTFQVSSLALMKMDTRMSEKVIQGLAFITQGIRNYFVTKSNTPVVMIGWQQSSATAAHNMDSPSILELYESMQQQTFLEEQIEEWSE
jgi:hypothetical protein